MKAHWSITYEPLRLTKHLAWFEATKHQACSVPANRPRLYFTWLLILFRKRYSFLAFFHKIPPIRTQKNFFCKKNIESGKKKQFTTTSCRFISYGRVFISFKLNSILRCFLFAFVQLFPLPGALVDTRKTLEASKRTLRAVHFGVSFYLSPALTVRYSDSWLWKRFFTLHRANTDYGECNMICIASLFIVLSTLLSINLSFLPSPLIPFLLSPSDVVVVVKNKRAIYDTKQNDTI